jgi:hypothetical protein
VLIQITLAIKSPATTWLGAEIFEDAFGTMPHLMYITGRTAPKALVTDTASEVSRSLVMTINIRAARPSC